MTAQHRPARVRFTFVIILVACVGLLAAGILVARQQRRQSRATQALTTGRAALARQDWVTAAVQLRRYLVLNSTDADVLLQYADANLAIRPLQADHVLKALRAYRRLVDLRPADVGVQRRLVQLCMDAGEYAEAEQHAQRWQSAGGGAEATRQLAAALYRQRQLEQARQVLAALLANQPQDVAAAALLADVLIDSDDRAGAVAAVDQAVAAQPGSAEALVNRAFYRRLLERNAQALEDLEQAESLPGTSPVVLLKLADEWRQWARADRARTVLERLGDVNPEQLPVGEVDADTFRLLRFVITSRVLRSLGDRPACIQLADAALPTIEPWQRVTYLPFAIELYLAGQAPEQAEQAIAQYAELAAQLPGDQSAAALNRLGLMQAALALTREQTFEAIDLLEGVLVADSRNIEARRALWQAYGRTEQHNRKVTHLETYVSLKPEDADAALELARSYRGLDWARVAHFAKAAEEISGNPQAALLRLEAQIAQAAEAGDAQRLSPAAAELDEMRARRPDLSEIVVLQARIATLEGRAEDAELALRSALDGPAARPDVAVTLAGLYMRAGRDAEAVKVLEDAAARFAGSASPRLALARLFADAGQADQAVRELQDLRGDLPGDLRCRLELLEFPEVQADNAQARGLVDEIKSIEGQAGLHWRLEQARLELRRDGWQACSSGPASAAESDSAPDSGAEQVEESSSAPIEETAPLQRACADRAERVEALLAECIAHRPSWPAPRIELGRLYERTGRVDRAEQVYRRLVEAQPGHVLALSHLLELLVQQGRYKDADAVLQRLPADATGLEHIRIQVAWETGDYAAAAQQLRRRITARPQDAGARVLLARLLYEQNLQTRDEALALLDEAGRLDPDLLSRVAAAAWIYRQENLIEQADALIDEHVQRRDDYETCALRASHYESTGRAEAAEAEYRRLASFAGMIPRAQAVLGRHLRDHGRVDEALAAWRTGLGHAPHDPALQRLLIETLLSGDEPSWRQEGLALLEAELERAPDDPDYLYLKAEMVFGEGAPDARAAARELLERACRMEPRHVPACHLLARVMWEQGETRQALERVLLARGASPRQPDLVLLQAEFENRLNHPEVARRLVNFVLQLNPQHAGGHRLLQHLDLQELAVRGDFDGLLNKSRQLHDPSPGERVMVAHLLAATGNSRTLKEAHILCERAAHDDPSLVEAHLGLGRIDYALGDFDAAQRSYRQALKLDPGNREALNDLAWVLATELAQPVEALGLASQGLSYYPDTPELLHTRGVVYRRLGDLTAAAADLNRCIDTSDPQPGTQAAALLELAEIYMRQGQTQRTREALKALRSISPQAPLAETQQARLTTLDKQLEG